MKRKDIIALVLFLFFITSFFLSFFVALKVILMGLIVVYAFAANSLKEKIILEKSKGKLILITSHILSDLDDITTHVMYLQEGRVHFFKKLQTLQEETGETRLGKAIARIMKREKANTLKIKDIIKTNQEEIIK